VTFAGEGRPRLALVHCGSIIDGVLLMVGGESGRRFRGEGGSTRGGLVCMYAAREALGLMHARAAWWIGDRAGLLQVSRWVSKYQGM
jgi:hypothetical protein